MSAGRLYESPKLIRRSDRELRAVCDAWKNSIGISTRPGAFFCFITAKISRTSSAASEGTFSHSYWTVGIAVNVFLKE